MAREIKFRAWFPKEHYSEPRMAYLDINDDFGGNSATWQLRNLQHPKEDSPIYMQFTGLKDKNGKETYEGDIVQPYLSKTHKTDTRVVKYLDHGFTMCDLDTTDGLDGIWYYDFEVIGNIYENPELLK